MSPNHAADTETEAAEARWMEGFASSEYWLAALADALEADGGEDAAPDADARFPTQALTDYYSRY
jgi:hypothetical protein